MLLPFSLNKDSAEPLYQQLKRHLAHQIESGLLPPGMRLPPSRQLAADLRVSRISIVTAYDELATDGLIQARVGRGTFVAERFLAEGRPARWNAQSAPLAVDAGSEQPDVISFSQGAPADEFLPVETFHTVIDRVLTRDGAAAMAYEQPEGYPPLRAAIAAHVASLGIEVAASDVLVTGGCQQALDLAVQSLLYPGDVLLTSDPTYLGMLNIARARAVQVAGVPMDADGMQTGELERYIEEYRPRLLYVAPTFHNPTGTVMPVARRRHLLDVAARYNLPVLEDGAHEELSYGQSPPPSLKALDKNGLVLYASGFSKVLMPGMRIGYLLAGGALYERLVGVKQAADICTPALNQRAIQLFLSDGHMRAHLEQVRKVCRQRRDAALESAAAHLPEGCAWHVPQGGQYLWVAFPATGPTAADLYTQALQQGVAFAVGDAFSASGEPSRHVRLNVIAHPPEVTAEGFRRLAVAWRKMIA